MSALAKFTEAPATHKNGNSSIKSGNVAKMVMARRWVDVHEDFASTVDVEENNFCSFGFRDGNRECKLASGGGQIPSSMVNNYALNNAKSEEISGDKNKRDTLESSKRFVDNFKPTILNMDFRRMRRQFYGIRKRVSRFKILTIVLFCCMLFFWGGLFIDGEDHVTDDGVALYWKMSIGLQMNQVPEVAACAIALFSVLLFCHLAHRIVSCSLPWAERLSNTFIMGVLIYIFTCYVILRKRITGTLMHILLIIYVCLNLVVLLIVYVSIKNGPQMALEGKLFKCSEHMELIAKKNDGAVFSRYNDVSNALNNQAFCILRGLFFCCWRRATRVIAGKAKNVSKCRRMCTCCHRRARKRNVHTRISEKPIQEKAFNIYINCESKTEYNLESNVTSVEFVKNSSHTSFIKLLSMAPEWAYTATATAAAAAEIAATTAAAAAVAAYAAVDSDIDIHSPTIGLAKWSHQLRYKGMMDSQGRPHGFGEWLEDQHFGERLEGLWWRGFPVGPFVSQEVGTGSQFVNVRVGICQSRLDAQMPSRASRHWNVYGVGRSETSTSGHFFKGLPITQFFCPTNAAPLASEEFLSLLKSSLVLRHSLDKREEPLKRKKRKQCNCQKYAHFCSRKTTFIKQRNSKISKNKVHVSEEGHEDMHEYMENEEVDSPGRELKSNDSEKKLEPQNFERSKYKNTKTHLPNFLKQRLEDCEGTTTMDWCMRMMRYHIYPSDNSFRGVDPDIITYLEVHIDSHTKGICIPGYEYVGGEAKISARDDEARECSIEKTNRTAYEVTIRVGMYNEGDPEQSSGGFTEPADPCLPVRKNPRSNSLKYNSTRSSNCQPKMQLCLEPQLERLKYNFEAPTCGSYSKKIIKDSSELHSCTRLERHSTVAEDDGDFHFEKMKPTGRAYRESNAVTVKASEQLDSENYEAEGGQKNAEGIGHAGASVLTITAPPDNVSYRCLMLENENTGTHVDGRFRECSAADKAVRIIATPTRRSRLDAQSEVSDLNALKCRMEPEEEGLDAEFCFDHDELYIPNSAHSPICTANNAEGLPTLVGEPNGPETSTDREERKERIIYLSEPSHIMAYYGISKDLINDTSEVGRVNKRHKKMSPRNYLRERAQGVNADQQYHAYWESSSLDGIRSVSRVNVRDRTMHSADSAGESDKKKDLSVTERPYYEGARTKNWIALPAGIERQRKYNAGLVDGNHVSARPHRGCTEASVFHQEDEARERSKWADRRWGRLVLNGWRPVSHETCDTVLVFIHGFNVEIEQDLAANGVKTVHFLSHSAGARVLHRGIRKCVEHGLFHMISDMKRAGAGRHHKNKKALMRVASITMVNPDFPVDDFLNWGYALLRKICSHLSIYGDTRDQALSFSEKYNQELCLGKRVFDLQQKGAVNPTESQNGKEESTVHICKTPLTPELTELLNPMNNRCETVDAKEFPFSALQPGSELKITETLSTVQEHSPEKELNFKENNEFKSNSKTFNVSEACEFVHTTGGSQWLDLDVIDTTFVEGHTDFLKHCFYQVNREIVDDIREILTYGLRAASRVSRLDRRRGNVYCFRVTPSSVKSLY